MCRPVSSPVHGPASGLCQLCSAEAGVPAASCPPVKAVSSVGDASSAEKHWPDLGPASRPGGGSDGASQPRVGACHVQNPRLSGEERLVLLHQKRGAQEAGPVPAAEPGQASTVCAIPSPCRSCWARTPGKGLSTTTSVPSSLLHHLLPLRPPHCSSSKPFCSQRFLPNTFPPLKHPPQGFPGGPVVKNPLANAGALASILGLGRSHMPPSN